MDVQQAALRRLRSNIQELGCDAAEVVQADGLGWLEKGPPQPGLIDVAFLDPPFGEDILPRACELLESRQWLAAGARVYLESGSREPEFAPPERWTAHRDKLAGEVRYRLFVVPD